MSDTRPDILTGDDLAVRLRAAVKGEPAAPFLDARVRANLKPVSRRPSWVFSLAAVSTMLLCVLSVDALFVHGWFRWTRPLQDSYIASLRERIHPLLFAGAGDHLHCTVYRKFKAQPPSSEELSRKIGEKNLPLLKMVAANAPSGYVPVIAHKCRHSGREFIHVALRKGTRVLSMITTEAGPDLEPSGLVPVLKAAGTEVYAAGIDGMRISAFRAGGRVAYLVSDLSDQDHSTMLLALLPGLQTFLAG